MTRKSLCPVCVSIVFIFSQNFIFEKFCSRLMLDSRCNFMSNNLVWNSLSAPILSIWLIPSFPFVLHVSRFSFRQRALIKLIYSFSHCAFPVKTFIFKRLLHLFHKCRKFFSRRLQLDLSLLFGWVPQFPCKYIYLISLYKFHKECCYYYFLF